MVIYHRDNYHDEEIIFHR